MKNNFKKFACLLLGIFVFIANTPVCAQDFHGTIHSISVLSPSEIHELEYLVHQIAKYHHMSYYNISFSNRDIKMSLNNEFFIKPTNPYSPEETIYNSFKVYYKDIYTLEERVNTFQKRVYEIYNKYLETLPQGSYLRKATENYLKERVRPLFEAQKMAMDKMLSWADLIKEQPKILDLYTANQSSVFINENAKYRFYKKIYEKDAYVRNAFLEDLTEYQKSTKVLFSWDTENIFKQIKRMDSAFSPEAIAFFSKSEHTAEEIMAYFAQRTPEIQRSALYSLKVTDQGVTVNQLLNYTQEYLKKTNKRLLKVKKLSPELLRTMLSKMSVANRTHFVESLVNFEPEAKALAHEIRQAEKAAGKKLLSRNVSKITTPLFILGSFLFVAGIMQIQAQNNFSEVPDIVDIQNKINKGEFLSFDEISFYITDESSRSEINKNLEILPEAFEAATAVNAWLDDIDEIIENAEGFSKNNQENTYNAFEQYYQDNLEKINEQITK